MQLLNINTKLNTLMEQAIENSTAQLEKVITYLSEDEGIRGTLYSGGSLIAGLFPTMLNINVLELFQILAYAGSIIVAALTSYGMIKKYIKEFKKTKEVKNEPSNS